MKAYCDTTHIEPETSILLPINKAQTTYIPIIPIIPISPIIPIIPIIPKSESEYGKNSQKMSEEFEHSRVAWAEEVTKLLGRREAFANRSWHLT